MSRELEIIIEGLRAIRDDIHELIEELDATERKRKLPDSLVPYHASDEARRESGHKNSDF